MFLSKQEKVALIGGLLKIVDKDGIEVPFVFNPMQRHFHTNKGKRNIILKHRQGGMSSSILADEYTDCITTKHAHCAVVSHEGEATKRLLDRVHYYHDTLEPPKPEVDAYSRNEISFPDMHSSIYIGTAGSRAFGRGDTINKALLSELAYYDDATKIRTAVEDAVPMGGELDIECTPNGEDGVGADFHEQWVRAKEGRSPYKPFFYPWWWTPEYALPPGHELALDEDKGELHYTDEEIELIGIALRNGFNLTEDHIRWRRYKIGEKQGLFWQEYPEDEISCFITIGDPFFDQLVLNQLASQCYEGKKHEGGWTYWIPPLEGETYVIGADTSAGAPTGSYSASCVLDSQYRVCSTYQARVQPNVFAEVLKQQGLWYNGAKLAVERNFTGYAVLGALVGGHTVDNPEVKMGNYPNIYRQVDFLTGRITNNLGWWSNDQTKGHMRTVTTQLLPKLQIWDVNLVRQLRSYRYIKMKPTPQTFDDLAIALQIACSVRMAEGTAQGYRGSVPGYNW